MVKSLALIFCFLVSVFVNAQPTINPGGPAGFCPGDSILLAVFGSAPGSTYQWIKSGTPVPGATKNNYFVSTPATYSVLVTNAGNTTQLNNVVVSAFSPPVGSFIVDNSNPCSGTNIQFTSTVSNGTSPFNYSWDFGDGNTSTIQNPTHTYDTLGCGNVSYNTRLTVTDANGCSSIATRQINVKPAPNLQLKDVDSLFSSFGNCGNNPTAANPNYTLTVVNSSASAACISSYSLDWGDGSAIVNNPTFPLSHTYMQLGSFNLVFSAIGNNGCSNSKTYVVANQTNPAGGLGTLGSTVGLCAPSTIPFIISNWQNNSPGTKYILTFGDGNSVTLTHPLLNDTVIHTYTKSSCPDSATYTVKLLVVNACASTPFTAGAIQVRVKSIAQFTSPDSVCVNKSIQFSSTSSTGYSGSSCSVATQLLWDFGDGSPQSSVPSPSHIYALPGKYIVTLRTKNPCDTSSFIKSICVTGPATSSFTFDKVEGCAPLNVIATNNSTNGATCSQASYKWTVSYAPAYCSITSSWSFNNGSDSASANPSFIFTSPGTYTVTLAVTNACGTVTSKNTVLIKQPPVITLPVIPNICSSYILNPTATVNNCGNNTLSYLWTFTGGTPSTSTSSTPGPVTFSTPGTKSVTLAVTNECGTTTSTRTFIINPAPDLVVPANAIYCDSTRTAPFTFTSTNPGTSFKWTNDNTTIGLGASGTGTTIASFLTKNNTQNPSTATITVTALGDSGCSKTQSFTITINPRPSKPITVKSVSYCLNENALPLSATPSTGNTLNWYTSNLLVNGSNTTPIPSTTTAGIIIYYVTQSNSFGCESDTARITVTVNPKITNNSIGATQAICYGSSASPLVSNATGGGSGAYAYQWQSSIDGGVTWINITGAVSSSFNPGAITTTTQYRRIVNSSSCQDTSNIVSIVVHDSIINTGITGSQIICAGSAPNTLIGQTSSSGNTPVSYQWENSTDNINWTSIVGANSQNYAPPVLFITTYYRRKVTGDQCSVYSGSIQITVNAKPTITSVADQYYCNNSQTGVIAFSGTPSGSTYTWVNSNTQIGLTASGSGNIPSFTTTNNSNPKIPITGNIKVVHVNANNSLGCTGDTMTFNIVVLPVISIATIPDDVKCTGTVIPALTPVPDTGSFAGISVQYSWTVTGSGISLSSGTGSQIPSYTTVNTGTTDLIATVKITPVYNFNGKTCNGTLSSYTITVKPLTPPANAGADIVLCNAVTATLSANFVNGTTGVWSQVGSGVTIVSPSSNITKVNNLQPGVTYRFVWTQSGFASCPSTTDTMTVDNKSALVNKIDTVTKLICSGTNIDITGELPTGGSEFYTYQWQQSSDGINFINITGATSQSINFAATTPVWLRRFVNSPPCNSNSAAVRIIMQPAITNNNISSSGTICTGTTAQTIIGTQPAGGDNQFNYIWEQSSNGGNTWSVIPGASGLNYSPGVLFQTTSYHRRVETSLCNGVSGNVSNQVTITVNAKITNNVISASQVVCYGTAAEPLTSLTTGGGTGSYAYQWQSSADSGTTWININGVVSSTFNPGVVTVTAQYRRLAFSGSCGDTSNFVSITVQSSLTNTSISGTQTICTGSRPDTLFGQLQENNNAIVIYQWENSTDSIKWTTINGATSQNYLPPSLTVTTYYRRTVKSGQCTATSQTVRITVNSKPVITSVNDLFFCNNSPLNIGFNVVPASSTYSWINNNIQTGLAANGNGDISATTSNNSNPKVPISANIKVAPTFTYNNVACPGDTVAFNITVLPSIKLAPIKNEVQCTGVIIPALTPTPDTGSAKGISILYSWVVSGKGITLVNGSGSSVPAYTTVNNGSTDLIATVTITPQYTYNGKTCDGSPTSYTVTVKPATPGANAGPDMVLCNSSTTTLSASFVNGTTGMWTQLGTNAAIASPTSNITLINNLQPDVIYQFVWTQTGFASCPVTSDTIVVDNKSGLLNKIDTITKIICTGVNIGATGQIPTGGSGRYTYQWQQSTDGITYTNINGATSQNISITPVTTVWLRRYVDAAPCFSYSDTLHVIVQPALTNNTIGSDSTICTGTTSPQLIGSLPEGASNQFIYVWEQSTDGGATWVTIPGASDLNYSPGVLLKTTSFRRRMSTSTCNGFFASISNTVTITVTPDAKAQFTSTNTLKCPPFIITASYINTQVSPVNSKYLWYANGTLLGSGATFPGYTIVNGNDSVNIKLVAVSVYGCKNDSLLQEFYTEKIANPSFTLSDTVACGPATIQATNTSVFLNKFTYSWDFGNGQTSTQIQPAPIQYAANPNYNDTVYTINLKVFSVCDTLTYSRNLRVKARPKALFTPSITTGCSPMKVMFQNTSKGNNNTYLWDFGDGVTLSTTSLDSVQHTYITGVIDTFYARLIAVNECGADTLQYSIIVSPNTILLNFAVNGTDLFGCSPHAVSFINNSRGASVFHWNFGDGNTTTTTKNIDTVYHTYLTAGTFKVMLQALNSCSDTTNFQTITVYPKPNADFTINKYKICKGDTAKFTSASDNTTAYSWQFGDGATSSLSNPIHIYTTAGTYTVTLTANIFNPSGNVCTNTTSQQIEVAGTLTGSFTVSDTIGKCTPLTVSFVNQVRPSTTSTWDFGDLGSASGDSVVHTFLTAGTFTVTLTVTVPGGCTYITTRTITVSGPSGSLQYQKGYSCQQNPVRLQAVANGATSYLWDFGDGVTQTTTQQVVFHNYINPGEYVPSVILQNAAGCNVPITGIDTIKVERLETGFIYTRQSLCGSSILNFIDTSHVFFGKSSVNWDFGDGSFGSGNSQAHTYTTSGNYIIQMIVLSNSGCVDTVVKQLSIVVNSKPIASIDAPANGCSGASINFLAVIQSTDAINSIRWSASDGSTGSGETFSHIFNLPGTYTIQLISGTESGCYDTANHTIQINQSPSISVTPSLSICLGATTQLNATVAETYQWMPLQGLSCYTCAAPVASPTVTTPYVVEGKNSFGCPAYDTVVVTVIQPLHMNVPPNDSICIGKSTILLVSGASSYNWSPAEGLNDTTISNPTASPTVTTTYRVVGYDGFNCFTDTAFITVGIGLPPTVDLGPDLTLATGTLQPLTSTITNGPISKWLWSPVTNLSCSTCALPLAEIKKDITYSVIATTQYGCSASDTINIKAFCSNTQVFIPNAFTPDGDGLNDILMVRSKGIVQIKSFRIFNRWGDLVFERDNFPPNDPLYGWDGSVKNQKGGPNVFIYTCEVICENGSVFTYKGNVTIIK